ncbi:MAG: hypothetical protein IJV22_08005 [Bacteroidales bacterium]|nr:hypothetical protein [Bacteroidales bacterium]
MKEISHPFAIVVEEGNSQGRFSREQLSAFVTHLLGKGLSIFFNGNYTELCNYLPKEQTVNIIDGYRYPLHEYMYVIKHARLMVTPNTGLYHFATQLGCPCVVTTLRECLTLDMDNPIQQHLLDPKLEEAYRTQGIANLCPYGYYECDQTVFPIEQLLSAIDDLLAKTEKE